MSEKLKQASSRARECIKRARETWPPPTMTEIRDIYRMAASESGTIFYRCKFTYSNRKTAPPPE